MKLKHGKSYVTMGGWIVEIVEYENFLYATQRTSPGLLGGRTIAEFSEKYYDGADKKKMGWRYYDDGVIMSHGYSHSIGNELKIVAEYPNKLVDPPTGYVWKGGFPKLEETIEGKHYVDLLNNKVLTHRRDCGLLNNAHFGKKRIALVASPPQEIWPKYYINNKISKNWGVVRYDEKRCHFFQIVEHENNIGGGPFDWWHDDILARGTWKQVTKEEMVARFDKDPLIESSPQAEHSVVVAQEQYYIFSEKYGGSSPTNKYFVKRGDQWFNYNQHSKEEYLDGSPESFWNAFIADGKIKPCTKEEAMKQISSPVSTLTITGPPVAATNCVVTNPSPVLKEEQMKSSVFVNAVKSVASRTIGAANYLYVEPTKIIGGYVKRSLRYFVLAGTVSAIVYGVNDPAALKKRVASFVPKITIEAPSAMR